jgi:Protein of unknown function (DUF4230)
MARGESSSTQEQRKGGAAPGEHAGPQVVVRVDRRRGLWSLFALVAVALAVLFAARSCDSVLGLQNPFRERVTDRSQPVLLESIKDLSRYEAATANMQIVIDIEKDAKFIPSAVFGERTLFVAAGSVDAYVDFAGLGGNAVSVSGDRRSVTLRLPRPGLEKPNLDQGRSYVVSQQRGIVNRIQEFVGPEPNRLQKLYVLAEQRLTAAAEESALVARAEQNARVMLTGLLRSLGFTTVTIEFKAP